MFDISFQLSDVLVNLPTVGLLIFIEGILSLDNALVLAVLARGVPEHQQKKVLTYGLLGAVVFRLVAIGMASFLIQYSWIKFLGGGYLLWLTTKYFFFEDKEEEAREAKKRGFWMTVFLVELTDIAFAVDSILAAVALSNKYWVLVTGGLLGMILMRYMAGIMIGLLKKFPAFEDTAYFMVGLVGLKVVIEGAHFNGLDFHDPSNPAFIGFWVIMALVLLSGFRKKQS